MISDKICPNYIYSNIRESLLPQKRLREINLVNICDIMHTKHYYMNKHLISI